MSSNSAAIEKYRKQLREMLQDASGIDKKVLNKSINEGLTYAKGNTPVVTGFLRKSWASNPIQETDYGVQKELVNTADYSLYWDAGHRQVNGKGETVGWTEGAHLLDKVIDVVEKAEVKNFEAEIRRVQSSHD